MEHDPLNLVGSTIDDKYAVEEVVGEGGFSVVYRARHVIWKQPVALKCFKIGPLAAQDLRQELLDAFLQEGKLMTELSTRTSAIVQARDVGTVTRDDGAWIPYMVLEWLEGVPLDKVLDAAAARGEPPRPIESVVGMLTGAAEALALAHRRNIVHRDIKPANLFVTGDGRSGDDVVKILDFGVAKVMAEHLEHDKALKMTAATLTAFTPSYGAPEQFSRTYGATGPWTDVFAFALVLIEIMRSGHPALVGEEFLDLAKASTDENRRPTPRAFDLPVTDEVEAVFAKALSVRPADRYGNMRDFWCALRSAVFPQERRWTPPSLGSDSMAQRPSQDSGAMPFQPTQVAPDTGPRPDSAAVPSSPVPFAKEAVSTTTPLQSAAPAPARSRTAGAAILGGVVAAGLLGGGFFLLREPADKEAAAAPVASSAAPARPSCPEGMAYVPGGKFFMGSDEEKYPRWQPAHKVELSPFCLDIHEVTAKQYKECSDIGECKRPESTSEWPKPSKRTDREHARIQGIYSELCTFGNEELADHPINCVEWEDARAYCEVHRKRLPTEAEWEFAARGSDGRKFPWGDDPPTHRHMNACGTECNAWEKEAGLPPGPRMYDEDDGFAATAPVGSFPAGVTMFGMHDMVGNVFEWTADWMGTYTKDELRNPTGPARGEARVIRGGAFNGGFSLWVNPAFRYAMEPDAHTHGIGFRCAKSLPSSP
ncbi:MAG: SUMF1/EgtB/PvdO family nonheme iron enzyme [Myxococcota bacterium]